MKNGLSDEFYSGLAHALPISMVIWGFILLGAAWVFM